MYVLFDPEYPLLSVSSKEIFEKGHTDECTRIFTALFLITKAPEKLNSQSSH